MLRAYQHLSKWVTGTVLVTDKIEDDGDIAGGDNNTINNTLYEVFAESVLSIDDEVDME